VTFSVLSACILKIAFLIFTCSVMGAITGNCPMMDIVCSRDDYSSNTLHEEGHHGHYKTNEKPWCQRFYLHYKYKGNETKNLLA
jgi:hypothetical protein